MMIVPEAESPATSAQAEPPTVETDPPVPYWPRAGASSGCMGNTSCISWGRWVWCEAAPKAPGAESNDVCEIAPPAGFPPCNSGAEWGDKLPCQAACCSSNSRESPRETPATSVAWETCRDWWSPWYLCRTSSGKEEPKAPGAESREGWRIEEHLRPWVSCSSGAECGDKPTCQTASSSRDSPRCSPEAAANTAASVAARDRPATSCKDSSSSEVLELNAEPPKPGPDKWSPAAAWEALAAWGAWPCSAAEGDQDLRLELWFPDLSPCSSGLTVAIGGREARLCPELLCPEETPCSCSAWTELETALGWESPRWSPSYLCGTSSGKDEPKAPGAESREGWRIEEHLRPWVSCSSGAECGDKPTCQTASSSRDSPRCSPEAAANTAASVAARDRPATSCKDSSSSEVLELNVESPKPGPDKWSPAAAWEALAAWGAWPCSAAEGDQDLRLELWFPDLSPCSSGLTVAIGGREARLCPELLCPGETPCSCSAWTELETALGWESPRWSPSYLCGTSFIWQGWAQSTRCRK